MLVPNPKNAFQSPGTQSFGFALSMAVSVISVRRPPSVADAARMRFESDTQPKIPPWALIIFRPIS